MKRQTFIQDCKDISNCPNCKLFFSLKTDFTDISVRIKVFFVYVPYWMHRLFLHRLQHKTIIFWSFP